MKEIRLTKNQVLALFETFGDMPVRHNEVTNSAFEKLDHSLGDSSVVMLTPQELRAVRVVARNMQPFTLKKFKVKKSVIMRKLR